MLFNINKQKSLAIMQLTAALFVLLATSLIGELALGTGIYFLFTVFFAALCIRTVTTQRLVLSVSHIIYLILGAYAIISALWAGNREGHLLYFFAILIMIAFHALAGDYFNESAPESIRRRFMYLLSISGVICAILNFFCWIIKIVPVAGKTPLKEGLGTNDFLAIFIYFSILVSLLLIKGNSKTRKVLLLLAALGMSFVFIMAKSVVAWVFAMVFTLTYLSKRKGEKTFIIVAVSGTGFFLLCATIMISFSGFPTAFPDVFSVAVKHPFGLGGGFWSARETFSAANYTSVPHVGLLAYLFANSGILGIFACAFLMLRSLVLFLRLKNISSFAGMILCVAVVILPFGANITVVLFLIGLHAYNEQLAGMNFKLSIKEHMLKKITYVASILLIVSSMLFLHSVIRTSAKKAYSKKNYASSYSLYEAAGSINISDSESLRMATASLRKSGEIASRKDDAIRIIDKAIKRDKNNVQNIKEKALIYDACGEFELSAQQYREAAQKVFDKDSCNLLLVKELYKIVKKSPKGSAETKRSYEEIITIAQSTQNLDCKKEINDIADKVFKHTKGDILNEG